MTPAAPEQSRDLPVLIVGGGIAGLSAAWELQGRGVPYILLEAGERLGGKIHTHREGGFIVEEVADAFILQKPYAAQLARELGLEGETVHPDPQTRRLYFLKGASCG
ncbi:FAD-dependent oxidoreductase [Deinococcus lacus]|uniref:FAD-dependent oxidoreductase n=1 Tax=Deinococcus lacus TaxID=392561 RepID=A0ABW1YEA6_9DEIO